MDKLTDAEAASPSLSLFAALSYRAASMAMVFINKAVLLMEYSNSMTLLTMQVPVEVPYWNQVFRDPGWALMVDIGRGKARNEGSGNGNAESRSYLEKKLVFCFGSHIAAQMLLPFGEKNLLSSSELTQAQEIDFILCFLLFNGINSTALSMGNNHEYDMAVKVEKIHDLAYYKAKEMLHRNRRVLEKMVEELLEFEILTAKDLGRIFEENGGVREKEPFFLSGAHDRETLSGSFLEGGDVSATVLLT